MKDNAKAGICCPSCGSKWSGVTHTEPLAGKIRRRRACKRCGRHFVTLEIDPVEVRRER